MKLEVVQHTTGQLSRAKFSPDWRKWLGINTPNVNIRSKSPFFDGFLTHIGDSMYIMYIDHDEIQQRGIYLE